MAEPLLRTPEACDYLLKKHGIRRSPKTITKERHEGTGPAFHLIGSRSIGHTTAALDEYAERLISKQTFRSTVEAKAARRASGKAA